ncbi:MAG TPA: outer membrane beta-barrel protein [Steroidobacter sp.]
MLLRFRYPSPMALAATAAAFASVCAHAQSRSAEEEEEHFYLSEQYTYDDNLFRRAATAGPDGSPALDPALSRDDQINRITAGLANDFHFGRQTLRATGRVQDVRFRENDHLDHTAGRAHLGLDWRMLASWSGTLSATYNRTLADFAHLRTTRRDLVDSATYSGSARYKLGPRWSVSAHGQRIETEHSLDERSIDDVEASYGRFAIDYVTPTEHTFGLEYRHGRAKFPNFIALDPSQRSPEYEESAALARLVYTATVHTRFSATFGYVERDHLNGPEGDYSGNTWRAQIDWHPREKFSTVLDAWHEIKAYTDAESDYFIADGVSLTPRWSPRRWLWLGLEVSYEEQDYIAPSTLVESTPGRKDQVLSALATITYSPRDNLDLELQYSFGDRDSNRALRRYDAQVAGLAIRWRVL